MKLKSIKKSDYKGYVYDLVVSKNENFVCEGVVIHNCAKKKYMMQIYNSEGVDYNPPKLKIMGIEVVRSSTPHLVRKYLKDAIPIIFDKGIFALRDYAKDIEYRFKSSPVEKIAFPRGVNNIEKYDTGNGNYGPRTPMHVRASILYNHHTKPMPKYEKIKSGDKIKFVYLKMPNLIREDVIGFPATKSVPKELKLDNFIDFDRMFESVFLNPLQGIISPMGWKLVESSVLDDFA